MSGGICVTTLEEQVFQLILVYIQTSETNCKTKIDFPTDIDTKIIT